MSLIWFTDGFQCLKQRARSPCTAPIMIIIYRVSNTIWKKKLWCVKKDQYDYTNFYCHNAKLDFSRNFIIFKQLFEDYSLDERKVSKTLPWMQLLCNLVARRGRMQTKHLAILRRCNMTQTVHLAILHHGIRRLCKSFLSLLKTTKMQNNFCSDETLFKKSFLHSLFDDFAL